MKIKVCGMRDPENIAAVGALAPDYIGFIFAERSPRKLDPAAAPGICAACPAGISRVGVFCDQSFDLISGLITSCRFAAVQLHGNETPEECEKIRALGVQVIKAFPVDGSFRAGKVRDYENSCDIFLFDSEHGGSGQQFDRSLISEYRGPLPFLIAGGLESSEIRELRRSPPSPYFAGVDVNSKVEVSPGTKSIEKVREAIVEARA